MKRLTIPAILAVLAFALPASAQEGGYYDRSFSRLSYVKGDVYIQRAQDLGYEQGEVNLPVVQGDRIGTRDGRVEIQLGRGNYLRLDIDSLVDIVGLPQRDGDPSNFHLVAGGVFLRVQALEREKAFEIHTPDASFYILEEGLYRVDIISGRETEFLALSGQAEAAGEESSVLVRSGEMVGASEGRFTSDPQGVRARGDEFAAWNESRDGLYARRLGRTYLPAEYSDYDYELAEYGRWTYEASFGHVWVPSRVAVSWRPYTSGRWAWYPIVGWTWVSYEPWGWCTSHYGRWGWRHGLGWYWIPVSRWSWSPAWVHWYHASNYIGWSPLSFYNRPVVIINNVFYDRYAFDYVPNASRALVVVRRDQLQNRRLSQVVAGDGVVRNLGRISLQAAQPNLRPTLDRDSDVVSRARTVLGRENLRTVGRSFPAEGGRLTPSELRSPVIRKAETGQAPGGRSLEGREGLPARMTAPSRAAGTPAAAPSTKVVERAIRPKTGEAETPVRMVSPSRTAAPARVVERGAVSTSTTPRDATRIFPSRESSAGSVRSPAPARVVVPRQVKTPTASSPAKRTSTGDSSRGDGLAYSRTQPGNVAPPPIQAPVPRTSVAPARSSGRAASSGTRTSVSTPSRSTVAPIPSRSSGASSPLSRSLSTPSRSSGSSIAPSRVPSPSSRTASTPSRSSGASSSVSRILSTPSRSSGSSIAPSRVPSPSSRTVSTPSRSSSAPSRSVSSPSRSSGSAIRSTSAPARSAGSSSRVATGKTASSGAVRRK